MFALFSLGTIMIYLFATNRFDEFSRAPQFRRPDLTDQRIR
jgi:hypothetical protein